MRYKKKPVVIDAIQWTGDNLEEVFDFFGDYTNYSYIAYAAGCAHINELVINTLEGDMRVSPGDYIIRGVKGEYYPCKEDIFLQTYEEAEESFEDKCKKITEIDATSVSKEKFYPSLIRDVRFFDGGLQYLDTVVVMQTGTKSNNDKNLKKLIEQYMSCNDDIAWDCNVRHNKQKVKELATQIQMIISDKVNTIYKLQNQIQETIKYLKDQIPAYEYVGHVYFEGIDVVKLTKEQLNKLKYDTESCSGLWYSVEFDDYEGDSYQGYIYVPTGKKNEYFKIPYRD